jgi:hypothetical protein
MMSQSTTPKPQSIILPRVTPPEYYTTKAAEYYTTKAAEYYTTKAAEYYTTTYAASAC